MLAFSNTPLFLKAAFDNCPVFLKSGAAGRLRSLHQLLAENPNVKGGWVFSSRPFGELPEQKLTFLPIYFAGSAARER